MNKRLTRLIQQYLKQYEKNGSTHLAEKLGLCSRTIERYRDGKTTPGHLLAKNIALTCGASEKEAERISNEIWKARQHVA